LKQKARPSFEGPGLMTVVARKRTVATEFSDLPPISCAPVHPRPVTDRRHEGGPTSRADLKRGKGLQAPQSGHGGAKRFDPSREKLACGKASFEGAAHDKLGSRNSWFWCAALVSCAQRQPTNV